MLASSLPAPCRELLDQFGIDFNPNQTLRADQLYSDGRTDIRVFWLDHPESQSKRRRIEYRREVSFLSDPPPDFRAPKLWGHGATDEFIWVARGHIKGATLSELIASGTPFNAERVIADILNQLVALERLHLYHDDLRGHNTVLSDDGSACLIDFGSIASEPRDVKFPYNIFLCFFGFVYEIACRYRVDVIVDELETGRVVLQNIGALPEPFAAAFRRSLLSPIEQLSFAKLREMIDTPITEPEPWPSGIELLVSRLQEAVAKHQSFIREQRRAAARERDRLLRQAAEEKEQAAREREQAAREREQAVNERERAIVTQFESRTLSEILLDYARRRYRAVRPRLVERLRRDVP